MIQIKSRIDFNHYFFFIASMCLARVIQLLYIYKGPTENSKNKNKSKNQYIPSPECLSQVH